MEQITLTAALDMAVAQIRRNLSELGGKCQNHSGTNGFYAPCENNQWSCGFFPGEVWLAYKYTGDDFFLKYGNAYVDSFLRRIQNRVEVDHHDMGFLYSPSCVAAYKLTGNEDAKLAALLAADKLCGRYHEKGGFLQAWGQYGAEDNYRFIIDCLMNLPLLFWAAGESGKQKYRDIALLHLNTCLEYSFRDNGSTWHTVFMNPETGAFDRYETCQGYNDDSSWTCGQAFAIYGTALMHRITGDGRCKRYYEKTRDYFVSKLPADYCPYWDLIFGDGSKEPRDSSGAAIAVCGFLEMGDLDLAEKLLASLIDHYSVRNPAQSNGLLLHGTYSKHTVYNTCTEEGVDECVAWGDYFYMEALVRMSDYGNFRSFWV